MSDEDICRARLLSWHRINPFIRAINEGFWGCQQWHQPPLGTGDSTIVPCPPPKPSCQAGAAHCGDRMLPWAGRPFDPGQSFPGQIKALPLQLFFIPSSSPCPNLLSLGVSTSRSCQGGTEKLKIRFCSVLTRNTTEGSRRDGAGPGFGMLRAAMASSGNCAGKRSGRLEALWKEQPLFTSPGCSKREGGWNCASVEGEMFSSTDSLGSAVPRQTARHILGDEGAQPGFFIRGF